MAEVNMQDWTHWAEQQINDMHARLDTVLFNHQQRLVEMNWRMEGMEPSTEDRVEAFYGALNSMMEDRWEYKDAQDLDMLNDRLDDLQQDQEPDQDHTRSRGQEMDN
jgi:hypothetical protein